MLALINAGALRIRMACRWPLPALMQVMDAPGFYRCLHLNLLPYGKYKLPFDMIRHFLSFGILL